MRVASCGIISPILSPQLFSDSEATAPRKRRAAATLTIVLVAIVTSGAYFMVQVASADPCFARNDTGFRSCLDESDRAAFRLWFVFLADAQFYRRTPDVVDCAALVRHAYREALRTHTTEWLRLSTLPIRPSYPDVRRPPRAGAEGWPLFMISRAPKARFGEFADARTLIEYNTALVARHPEAARAGDLLYFHQPDQSQPDHVMVFVGRSVFERNGDDWIVYHTGPDSGVSAGDDPRHSGEVRKVRLADLVRHPSARWRPRRDNPSFAGVFRWLL